MKNLGSKLKEMNWKEFIIGHGEKIIFGMVVAFVLFCVATTQWGTYERKPEEFTQKVDNEDKAFQQSTLPDETRKEFIVRDPGDQVAGLLDGIPQSLTYQFSAKFVQPFTPRKEKLKEPILLPVQQLVADAGRALFQLQPEQPAGLDEPGIGIELAKGDEAKAPSINEVERPRGSAIDKPRIDGPRKTGATGRSGAGASGAGQSLLPGLDASGEDSGDGPENDIMAGQPGRRATADSGSMLESRGMRFIATRGVLQMKLLARNFQRALNLETEQEALALIEFHDFELQRMTRKDGPDPWSGEWEAVDVDYAVNLLRRVEFDLDVVGEEYRDAIFTMPLPYRVTGNWDKVGSSGRVIASHPMIKRLLSEKEKAEEEARSRALIEANEKTKAAKETAKGGFGGVQHDTRSISGRMSGNSNLQAAYSDRLKSISSQMGMNPDGGGAMPGGARGGMTGRAFGRMQVMATPELLLYRFLDFSVIPGKSYRYRVRLKALNPNYDRDLSEVQDASFREGRYRFTAWSEPSNPSSVEDETEFFVNNIDRRGVDIDVYQWMSETGSYVKGPFADLTRGERVATWVEEDVRGRSKGGVTTDVLRPADSSFLEETLDYVTPNTLIDYDRFTALKATDHPDLDLGTKSIKASLSQAIVLNRLGELELLDSASQAPVKKGYENLMDQQAKAWEHLKDTGGRSDGGVNSLLAEFGNEDGGDEGQMGGKPSSTRRRSSIKRGGNQGMQSQMMMQMQMEGGGGNF